MSGKIFVGVSAPLFSFFIIKSLLKGDISSVGLNFGRSGDLDGELFSVLRLLFTFSSVISMFLMLIVGGFLFLFLKAAVGPIFLSTMTLRFIDGVLC